jgi:two-component system, NarL family, invasion response regulator UvrY
MKEFLLMDRHWVVRWGMRCMLKDLYQECLIEEAEDEAQAIKKIKGKMFDLVIMEINIPDSNSVRLINFIQATCNELKIMVFSATSEKFHAKRYLDAGAKGFLPKSACKDEIRRAISLILNNRNCYSDNLINDFISNKRGNDNSNPSETLTSREFEIISFLLAGKSLTEISLLLNVQTSTIGTHKAKVFKKLNVKNLFDLFDLARVYEINIRNAQ